jgi:hypothetical protein
VNFELPRSKQVIKLSEIRDLDPALKRAIDEDTIEPFGLVRSVIYTIEVVFTVHHSFFSSPKGDMDLSIYRCSTA